MDEVQAMAVLGPTVPVPEVYQPCQSPARVFLRSGSDAIAHRDVEGRVAGVVLPQHSGLKCRSVIRSILKMFLLMSFHLA